MERAHTKTKFILIIKKENKISVNKKMLKHLVNEEPLAQGKFEIQDTESCVHIPKTDQYETKRELKLQYHCNFVKTQHKKYDSKYYKKRNTTCKKMRVQTIL